LISNKKLLHPPVTASVPMQQAQFIVSPQYGQAQLQFSNGFPQFSHMASNRTIPPVNFYRSTWLSSLRL